MIHLKEGGHYFPQSENEVPQSHFFNNDYIKNYGRHSYGVNCCQVAFLMLVKDLKRLGRSNVFRAEISNTMFEILSFFHFFGATKSTSAHFIWPEICL